MKTLKILKFPDKRLRNISLPIYKINKKIKKIAHKMLLTMHINDGIGLAAPQIGLFQQLIVIAKIEELKNPLILINPKIKKKKEIIYVEEGCLSIPKKKAIVPRYKKIEVEFIDINGKKKKIKSQSFLSICIQHEIDHLMGILFIDYTKKNL